MSSGADLRMSDRRAKRPVAIRTGALRPPGLSPLDFLPHADEGKPAPGTFRLGVSPGMVKRQGTQTVLRVEQMFEEHGGVFDIANLMRPTRPPGKGSGPRWRTRSGTVLDRTLTLESAFTRPPPKAPRHR
ncbi:MULTISPECIES: hypothetical protein [Streptomyces]|uniref:Uncharacterized protein n=1 Tax=Streptomyces eurythermus TaxID=42237 RepID=A0ABW6YZF4_9ACTN|nr:hypothetical protein [Streptomyces sp. DSM 40868]